MRRFLHDLLFALFFDDMGAGGSRSTTSPTPRTRSARRWAAPLALVLAASFTAACVPTPDASPDAGPRDVAPDIPTGPLIAPNAWETAASEVDPFDDRPDIVTCEKDVGWSIEELDGRSTLEVATGSCDYLAATQPLLSAITPGETITMHFAHFELTGAGQAHPAIAVDGEVVWEKRIPIPQSMFQVYVEEVTVPSGADPGAPIVFHLHNHGTNTYNLVDVRRTE